MKKLKLNRETLSVLNATELEQVHGGATDSIVIQRTIACPIQTLVCTGGPCVMTGGGGTVGSCTSECHISGPGTSVINPGG